MGCLEMIKIYDILQRQSKVPLITVFCCRVIVMEGNLRLEYFTAVARARSEWLCHVGLFDVVVKKRSKES